MVLNEEVFCKDSQTFRYRYHARNRRILPRYRGKRAEIKNKEVIVMIKVYIAAIANGKQMEFVDLFSPECTVEDCVMYSVKNEPGITGMRERGWCVNGVPVTDVHKKIAEFSQIDRGYYSEIYITHYVKCGDTGESFHGKYYEVTKGFKGFDDPKVQWVNGEPVIKR